MNRARESKETFDLVPELYDEIRPGYPAVVLQRIEEYADLTQSSKIVEIGPGTGQASDYLIKQGYNFLGIELGQELSSFAQQKYTDHSNAEFVCSSFEDWDYEAHSFDLLLAAQSFHWVGVDFGIKKAADILKKGGSIALLWNLDESQHTEFWKRGTPLHDEYFPDYSPTSSPNLQELSIAFGASLKSSELFTDVDVVEHTWQRVYSAEEWIRMRNTFSPDLSLPPSRRDAFHGKLKVLIEELGGSFTRHYRCVCILGHRI